MVSRMGISKVMMQKYGLLLKKHRNSDCEFNLPIAKSAIQMSSNPKFNIDTINP